MENQISSTHRIEDGEVIRWSGTNSFKLNLEDVQNVIYTNGTLVSRKHFYITNKNEIYASDEYFTSSTVPQSIIIAPDLEKNELRLREDDSNLIETIYEEGNIISATLTEEKLLLGFNGKISHIANYDNITLKTGGNCWE